MTVMENVAFGLRVRTRRLRPSRERSAKRCRRLLQLVQLEGLEARYPSQLSGGQRQRVALARRRPSSRRCCCWTSRSAPGREGPPGVAAWLRKLHRRIHVTSVFVTHDQEEALEVADRIVIMNRGRIEQEGTPNDVFLKPANAFVMDFLGNVNLFHGRVEGARPSSAAGDGLSGRARGNPPGGCWCVRTTWRFMCPARRPVHLPAQVLRILAAGPQVKIELSGPNSAGERRMPPRAFSPHEDRRRRSRTLSSARDARVFTEELQHLSGKLGGTGCASVSYAHWRDTSATQA